MNVSYITVIQLLQRVHRLYLAAIKWDLEQLGIQDINNSQCVILLNIGDYELTVGELTSRGIYLGSNVAYNVRQMAEAGYLTHERSQYDRRVSYVRATEKGRKLRDELINAHRRRVELLSEIAPTSDELRAATAALRLLDSFWTSLVYRVQSSP